MKGARALRDRLLRSLGSHWRSCAWMSVPIGVRPAQSRSVILKSNRDRSPVPQCKARGRKFDGVASGTSKKGARFAKVVTRRTDRMLRNCGHLGAPRRWYLSLNTAGPQRRRSRATAFDNDFGMETK